MKLSPILLLAIVLIAPTPARAMEVLGCAISLTPGFVNCVVNANKRAVRDAVKAANDAKDEVIDDLESSPFMAQLQAEKDLLVNTRESVTDMAACLAEANVNFGTVISNSINNPANLVSNRFQELLDEAMQSGQSLMPNAFSQIASGGSVTDVNLPAAVNEAFDAMMALAEQDPVARCAMPMVEAQANQVKQMALQVYPMVEQRLRTHAQNVLYPVIHQGVRVMVSDAMQAQLDQAGQGTAGQSATGRKSPPAKTPARRMSTMQKTPTKGVSGSAQKPPVAQSRLRTRAGGTFMQQATSAVQGVVASAVPNDITLIALGEFMARGLSPAALSMATGELQALTAAVNAGNPGSANTSNLQKLLDELTLGNEELFTNVALSTIRKYGHMVIDGGGEAIINYAVGTLGAGKSLVQEIVGAICSIGSVASGTPCAGIKWLVVALVEQLVMPTIVQAATFAVHTEWDRLVSCGTQTLLVPSEVTRGCQNVVGLLPWFPMTSTQALNFIMPSLAGTQQALETYQRAVRDLATAAKAAG